MYKITIKTVKADKVNTSTLFTDTWKQVLIAHSSFSIMASMQNWTRPSNIYGAEFSTDLLFDIYNEGSFTATPDVNNENLELEITMDVNPWD